MGVSKLFTPHSPLNCPCPTPRRRCARDGTSRLPPAPYPHLTPPSPVVCTVPLEFVNLVYSWGKKSIFGAF
jgi:hypothetical protein